jgi:hypothetical protein
VPIAAASIGQVYKATLPDGRDVAVKVQYPGVAAAVRADMQNLGVILRLMKSVFPGLDVNAMGEEIRQRIHEELDYELEAQNQRTLARSSRTTRSSSSPTCSPRCRTRRSSSASSCAAAGFEEIKQLPQAERDRLGEIIFRFYFGCMYRHRQFSGDPHPGNSMLLDDGRMAFLDFGLFKRIAEGVRDTELRIGQAGIEGDGEALLRELVGAGFIGDADRWDPQELLEQFAGLTWWYTQDAEVELTPEIATQVLIDMSDPRSRWYSHMRHESVPADHLFGRRLETLTLAVLSQLHASNNWHRIAREWLYGDPPVTELGRRKPPSTACRRAEAAGGRPGPAARARRRPRRPVRRRPAVDRARRRRGPRRDRRGGRVGAGGDGRGRRRADRRVLPVPGRRGSGRRALRGRRGDGVRAGGRDARRLRALLIARFAARDAAAELAGPRLRRLLDGAARRGFVAVLYVRILPGVPRHPANYAFGLTAIGLVPFAAATVPRHGAARVRLRRAGRDARRPALDRVRPRREPARRHGRPRPRARRARAADG